MIVGEMRRLIEFVDDDTEIKIVNTYNGLEYDIVEYHVDRTYEQVIITIEGD